MLCVRSTLQNLHDFPVMLYITHQKVVKNIDRDRKYIQTIFFINFIQNFGY